MEDGVEDNDVIFGYNGEEYTEAAQLQYLRQRHYAPDMGAFLTQDAYRGDLYEPISQNRYTYAGNDPVNYNDPGGDKAKNKSISNALNDLASAVKTAATWTNVAVAAEAVSKVGWTTQYRVNNPSASDRDAEAAYSVYKGLKATVQANETLMQAVKNLQTGVECKGSKAGTSSSEMGGSNRRGADKERTTQAMEDNFSWGAYLGAASWFIPGGLGYKAGAKIGTKFLTTKAGQSFVKAVANAGKGDNASKGWDVLKGIGAAASRGFNKLKNKFDDITETANKAINKIKGNKSYKPIVGDDGTTIPRPTWRQSEMDAAKAYPKYKEQQSFLDGKVVSYGTKGSVRPDLYKKRRSIDVKNYNVESPSGRSRLARNIESQYRQRLDHLPPRTKQTVLIDIRGQNISQSDLTSLYDDIMRRTKYGIKVKYKSN